MKTYVIVMVVLIFGFLVFGVYAAKNDFGYLALLSGLFCGKLSTSFFAELKADKKGETLSEEN